WPMSGSSWSTMRHAFMFKYWSPMSVGSWGLTVFGFCSFLSFIGSLWPERFLGRLFTRGVIGALLAIVGSIAGLFLAAYTGALLTATNDPVWSDSVWVAPLFLTSAASTGIAMMILILRNRRGVTLDALDRLERADVWALCLELAVFAVFLASLGA